MKTKLMAGACLALVLVALTTRSVPASSHREALAVLNEPCADNTDTYAWVSNASHDKLYLIMNFNPLHEPGQGNQGLRACNGYRYEFHIGTGTSLEDKVVYRVEFTNKLTPEAAPSATDGLGGGNELLWQLTGGTETMKVTRLTTQTSLRLLRLWEPKLPGKPSLVTISPFFQITMGHRLIGSSTVLVRSRVTTPEIPRAVQSAFTIRRSWTSTSTTFQMVAALSPANSTIPINWTKRESSTSST
jgi:hypothetical protein